MWRDDPPCSTRPLQSCTGAPRQTLQTIRSEDYIGTILTALTCHHEPAIVQSQASDSLSCRGQAGHILPGAAPLLLQDLSGCQVATAVTATHNVNLHEECKYQYSLHNSNLTTEPSEREKSPQAWNCRPCWSCGNASEVPSCW